MTKHRSHSAAFKRQVAEEFIAGETLHAVEAARHLAAALSEQTLGPRAAVLVLGHEQPVPIFQQLAGGHPSGRDEYVRYPLVL